MEYCLNRDDQAFASGIFHQKSVYVRRCDSHVAYLMVGSSNHTTFSRCSDELDVLSLVLVSHPDTAVTLHRWEQAKVRSDIWKSDQVDAEGRSRFANVDGSTVGGNRSQKGPFTRIALSGSVETPFVPENSRVRCFVSKPAVRK